MEVVKVRGKKQLNAVVVVDCQNKIDSVGFEVPFDWQLAGKQKYGKKVPSVWMLGFNNNLYRVYSDIDESFTTLRNYIVLNGKEREVL